jgi:Amt family ammonium transporter
VLQVATVFKDQSSNGVFTADVFYVLASVCLFLVVVAFGLIDSGLVRRKNLLDTWVQKITAALLAGGAFLIIGYGIWQWQFNSAFGIKNPLGQAIKDWWIGGHNMSTLAEDIDPKVVPESDVQQIFVVFFFAYAAALGALIHSAGLERVKAAPLYILSVVAGGLIMPVLAYLTWGSVSPLTNAGVHDYVGNFSFYIFVGVWALLIAWRAGPRLGVVTPHPAAGSPLPHNMGRTAFGVGLLMFAIPFLVLGCGYFVPDVGYFGIALTKSGIGLVTINIFASFFGGALVGTLIAYRTRNATMALLGPIAGYVSGTAGFDVFKPWQMILVAMGGPIVVYGGYRLMAKLKIDEQKVVPLALFGGIYGAIVVGFVKWHTPTGGYFGLTGKYAPGNSQITPGWQLIGVLVVVGAALISGLILLFLIEKTIGLRVTEQDEVEGLDTSYWDMPSAEEQFLPTPRPIPTGAHTGTPLATTAPLESPTE